MAQMIPDRLPSGSSKGEQRLFAILQKLPDDYIVYYEPVVSDRYPDFVMIAPDLGVAVIEVKGWNPNDILGGDPQTVRVRDRGVEKNEAHPVRQARGYQNNLQDECRKSREARSLLPNVEDRQLGRVVPGLDPDLRMDHPPQDVHLAGRQRRDVPERVEERLDLLADGLGRELFPFEQPVPRQHPGRREEGRQVAQPVALQLLGRDVRQDGEVAEGEDELALELPAGVKEE